MGKIGNNCCSCGKEIFTYGKPINAICYKCATTMRGDTIRENLNKDIMGGGVREPKWGESIREHQDKQLATIRESVEVVDELGQRTGVHTHELPNLLLDEQILADMKRKLATYQELANPINQQIATLQANIWKMEDPSGYQKHKDREDHV